MAAPDQEVIEAIIKSPNDKKLYRYFKHESGMSVLLITDPEINSTPKQGTGSGVCEKKQVRRSQYLPKTMMAAFNQMTICDGTVDLQISCHYANNIGSMPILDAYN